MNPRAIIVLACLISTLVGGAAGYFLGRSSAESKLTSASARGTQSGEEPPIGRAPGANSAPEKTDPSAAGSGEEGGQNVSSQSGAAMDVADRTARQILEQAGPMARWREMMEFAEIADGDQMQAALKELEEMPQGIDSIVAKFFLYSRYAEGNPEAAMEALGDIDRDDYELAGASILGGWASEDPQAAAAYLISQVKSDEDYETMNSRLVNSVVDEWARSDPRAAFAWCDHLRGNVRDSAIGAVLGQWATRNPAEAADFARELPPGEERKNAFRVVAEKWASRDPVRTFQWAESLSPEERSPALATAIEGWSREDPVTAAEYLDRIAPGADREQATRWVGVNWGKESPVTAADWLLSQAPSDSRSKGLRDIMGNWARQDSLAASQWLANQIPGPEIDGAVMALTNEVVATDPEAAVIWASTINNPISRTLQVKSIARSWLQKDRAAAANWIDASGLDPGLKTELLSD